MTKTAIMFSTGWIMFMSGMYLSTYLSTLPVAVGTALAIVGGGLMGTSAIFLPKPKRKSNSNA
ncbi:hypothetical protein BHE17_14760 [Planococcus maritimus]|uniref:hypothetical protein n=1 Tax=Planococcus maritimus TaxID=192421 RepID=UPI00084BDB70|nr:hypothetical protein [Planococcus maritimus]OED33647.1 hypothetical protein BHE17_14760 [Planococcus maritimus]